LGVGGVAFLARWPVRLVLVDEVTEGQRLLGLRQLRHLAAADEEEPQVGTVGKNQSPLMEQFKISLQHNLELLGFLLGVRLEGVLEPFATEVEDEPVAVATYIEGCHVNALSSPRPSHFLPNSCPVGSRT